MDQSIVAFILFSASIGRKLGVSTVAFSLRIGNLKINAGKFGVGMKFYRSQ